MSDRDDDEGLDDPMLRQMRAVWLSMRDEEPPQSGLSALLVAAREKAEQMRPKQSLWSRFLAGMRRPPVLALASVVVLLGGAIALTTRSGSLDVNDKEDDKRMKAPAMPSPVQPPAEPPTTATVPADQGELQKSGDETRTPPVAQEAPRERPPTPSRPRPNTATAKRPAPPPAASPDRGFGGDGVAGRLEQAPPPPAPPPRAKAEDKKPEGKLSIATDDDAAAPRNEPAPAGAPVEETSANAEAPKKEQQPSTAQLVQQCETAATRGDCAAVRAIAERIKKLDGAVYRDRVQKNAAIARCLK